MPCLEISIPTVDNNSQNHDSDTIDAQGEQL